MLVTYVDRCSACACSSLRDEGGQRPLPGVVGCGRACRCHANQHGLRAASAVTANDAARFRFWRRARAAGEGVAAIR
jgi:hypothetical protein